MEPAVTGSSKELDLESGTGLADDVAGPDDFVDSDTPADSDAPADGRRPAGEQPPAGTGLDERDVRILAFERQWWRHAGSKEQAIRDTFDLSATRYYQILNGLLDNPAALERDPMLVRRLRRLRATRARTRSASTRR